MHASDPQPKPWRDRLHDLEREPNDAVWAKIESRLPTAKAPVRRLFPVWQAAAAAVVFAAGAFWFLRPEPDAVTGNELAQVNSAIRTETLINEPYALAPAATTSVQGGFTSETAQLSEVSKASTEAHNDKRSYVPATQNLAQGTDYKNNNTGNVAHFVSEVKSSGQPVVRNISMAAARQTVNPEDAGPLYYYEQGVEQFATANYCASHYHLNKARKHLCAREPLDLEINRLMTLIEHRVSSECICLAYEEAGQ